MKLCLTIQPNIIYQLYDELSLFICVHVVYKKINLTHLMSKFI